MSSPGREPWAGLSEPNSQEQDRKLRCAPRSLWTKRGRPFSHLWETFQFPSQTRVFLHARMFMFSFLRELSCLPFPSFLLPVTAGKPIYARFSV